MNTTTLHLHTRFQVGVVDPRIFGGFLEHMGRAVYEGVYQPESSHADEHGYRTDVLDALRHLDMTAMRYPGGNFASGYHWMDGIGAKAQRPTLRELAWQSLEPNQFGTDEYLHLCHKLGWTPMLTANLGTGTPEEARNWVEYCNCPTGSRYADMRAANGHAQPYGVKLWCLGNEMDGTWQLGHVPAEHYAIRAQQAAKMMKDADKSIELVACGSCNTTLSTYMEWDRQVLDYLGEVDYISLHRYVGNYENDTPDYLAISNSIDQQLEEMDAVCRFIQAKHHNKKRTYLCFDEWNVWFKNMQMDGEGKKAPHLIEEIYTLEDALVVAGFLQSFLRHADCLKIANLAQIVNVIAPILTQGDAMLLQSIYYPFAMFSSRRTGISLTPIVDGPEFASKNYGKTPYVDASAILDGNKLQVFLTNRSPDSAAPFSLNIADRNVVAVESAEILTGPDAKAVNSYAQPDLVCAQPYHEIKVQDGQAHCELPALSVVAMTLTIK